MTPSPQVINPVMAVPPGIIWNPAPIRAQSYHYWDTKISIGYQVATLLNASLFPIVAGLAIACVCLLVGRKAQEHLPPSKRKALVVYVAIMGALGLAAFIINLVHFGMYNSHWDRVSRTIVVSPLLPVCLWGAEGFMWLCPPTLWRMFVITALQPSDTTQGFIMGAATVIFSLLFLGSGLPLYFVKWYSRGNYLLTMISATVVLSLIGGIILYQRIYKDRVFDGIEKTFLAKARVVARLFVESGALLPIYTLLAIPSYDKQGFIFPVVNLPLICVLAPLLIVYLLAKCPEEGRIRLPDVEASAVDTQASAPLGNVVENANEGVQKPAISE